MDEIGLNELLQLIIKEKGGTPQQYNKMMDYIAFHETGHKQRMNPKAKQISGNEEDGFYDGPGRGLFQFEVGEKKGGNTAVNRTVRYFKDNNLAIPKWLHDVSMGSAGSKSVDVSDLSADQQKMLFLGYHKGHPVSDFSKVWNNEQTIQDFWAENHWAGDKENLTAKLALFNKNITAKDSIDALNIRKAELFGKDDKVPFQSAQNDPNRLPKESDILKSIFGQQTSLLVEDFTNSSSEVLYNIKPPRAEGFVQAVVEGVKEGVDDYRFRKDFRQWLKAEKKKTAKDKKWFNKHYPDNKTEHSKRSSNTRLPITNPLIAAMLSPLNAGRGSAVIDQETGINQYTGEQQYTPFIFGKE